MTCSDCRFWQTRGDGEAGECRKNPPLALLVPVSGLASPGGTRLQQMAIFPPTAATAWCGAFEEKPDQGRA